MDYQADFVEDHDEAASVITIDNDEILKPDYDSDEWDSSSGLSSCSGLSSDSSELGFCLPTGMTRVGEESEEFRVIARSFVSGMGDFSDGTSVVAVHRNTCSSLTGKARTQAFKAFSEAVAQKCGSGGRGANVKHGWYGGTREDIVQIVSHGFSRCNLGTKINGTGGESYGTGVYLSPAKFSFNSALAAAPDENGLRHVLLCRVILGNMETVPPGSNQSYPSSTNFDSGVDSLSDPRKYIVWSPYMNSHILPNYIVSFRSPPFRVSGVQRVATRTLKPNSPWMSFPRLLAMLSRLLPPRKMELIDMSYKRYKEHKCSRSQLIQKLRQVAGDSTLVTIIKCSRNKQVDNRVAMKAAFRSFMSGA